MIYSKKSWIRSDISDRLGLGRKCKIDDLRYYFNHAVDEVTKTIYLQLKDKNDNKVITVKEKMVISIAPKAAGENSVLNSPPQ